MSIMKRNSLNHDSKLEAPYCTLCADEVLGLRTEANAHGIEWHHAAGHSSGRERISFYPKNEEEKQAVNRLAQLVKERKAEQKAERQMLKSKNMPTTKAALWRYLETNGKEDKGFGCVEYKEGKYGKFVPTFGEADGVLFFDSEEIAKIANAKLYKKGAKTKWLNKRNTTHTKYQKNYTKS